MSRQQPSARIDYVHFQPIATRWMDNDVYGHVNNVVYYSYFDTAVNQYLMEQGVLRIGSSPVIGLVVDTGCSYFSSVAFPDALEIGLRVASMGKSSVRYELGVFRAGDQQASAQGHFVHVYVDAQTRRPTPLPDALRQALVRLKNEQEV
ncbi:acyl-CoA thioesterase [Bordetella genomosp. 12]|uniref:Thioesterase n=1 Tax=Bordetella genomosp. 12 TaxID=463035 RepID=A0A261VE87_9BORD|nr:thioesterase family protein [Bordetella genomosp. 12]OZI71862.1 thioesterase [Bordetella genomosp. 12]